MPVSSQNHYYLNVLYSIYYVDNPLKKSEDTQENKEEKK